MEKCFWAVQENEHKPDEIHLYVYVAGKPKLKTKIHPHIEHHLFPSKKVVGTQYRVLADSQLQKDLFKELGLTNEHHKRENEPWKNRKWKINEE